MQGADEYGELACMNGDADADDDDGSAFLVVYGDALAIRNALYVLLSGRCC